MAALGEMADRSNFNASNALETCKELEKSLDLLATPRKYCGNAEMNIHAIQRTYNQAIGKADGTPSKLFTAAREKLHNIIQDHNMQR